jgi:hypothetical protein
MSINIKTRRIPGRFKVRDTGDAIKFRMKALFAGDVGRFPGTTIDPCLLSASSLPVEAGDAVVLDFANGNNAVRAVIAADVAANTPIYGVVVRVYPTQQTSGGMSASFGNSAVGGPIVDVLTRGYVGVTCNGVPYKGSPAFVWAAASAGAHVQGRFEIAASAGNTIALDNKTRYNGPGDADGDTELQFNI